jgi:hypothetical protein
MKQEADKGNCRALEIGTTNTVVNVPRLLRRLYKELPQKEVKERKPKQRRQ